MSEQEQEYIDKFRLYIVLKGLSIRNDYTMKNLRSEMCASICPHREDGSCYDTKTMCINPKYDIIYVKDIPDDLYQKSKDFGPWYCIEWIKYV